MRAGFRGEAGKLALANSMEKLKYGNVEASESKAEANDLAIAQERQAVIERLKLAAGGKPALTPSSNVADSTSPSVPPTNDYASGGASAVAVSKDNSGGGFNPTASPLDSPLAKESRSNDRRKEMRAALDKLTGQTDEAGNLSELEAKNAKLAERKRLADLLKANTGSTTNLKPVIDSITQSRKENADLLRKLNKEVRIGGVRVPQYER